jgi:uncharacterized protein (TIGR02284 family)
MAQTKEQEAMTNDEVISLLNGLIEVCKDGQEGFKTAAEGIEESTMKTLFYEYSQQRAQFAGDLQNEVLRLGGDPEKSGSVAGSLHRGWIDIKSAILGKDMEAILNECERGEDSAVKNYKEALDNNIPSNVANLILRQSYAIQQAHDSVRNLRDNYKG